MATAPAPTTAAASTCRHAAVRSAHGQIGSGGHKRDPRNHAVEVHSVAGRATSRVGVLKAGDSGVEPLVTVMTNIFVYWH